MDSEPRDHDGSDAAIRAKARADRRRWWIDQCRAAIADGRQRVQVPDDDAEPENP
jgi:hypothetical protein